MPDLSDFNRGQIAGARIEDAGVTKTAELFGLVRSTATKVITALEKEWKTSSLKQNSGRKRKLFERDRWTLKWIVRKDHKNTVPKITAELNDHLEKAISSATVRSELHKAKSHGRTAIKIY